MHTEITSTEHPIYDTAVTEKLDWKNNYHELALKKQDNIQEAIIGFRTNLDKLKEVVRKPCGYCFKFRHNSRCSSCPIKQKLGKPCCNVLEWDEMLESITIAGFQMWHKEWCKKIGLDLERKNMNETETKLEQCNKDIELLKEQKAELEKQLESKEFAYICDYGQRHTRLVLYVTEFLKESIAKVNRPGYVAFDETGKITTMESSGYQNPTCSNTYSNPKPIFERN